MPEGFHSFRLECGHVHVHCRQRKTDECAIACAAMVIAMKKARYVDLDTLRQTSQALGGLYYRPSARDAGARVDNPVQRQLAMIMQHAVKGYVGEDAGTGIINVKAILQQYGVSGNQHENDVAGRIDAAAASNGMAIAFVAWNSGGAHFIVVHGSHENKYCILDPGTDHSVIRTCNAGSTHYSAPYGSIGRFDNCLIIA
jgi:hypothetical protein